jgi:hypothetical protein
MTGEGMSPDEYEAARSELYDYVRTQLLLIAKLKYKQRRPMIAHQVRCTDCDDVVTEVIWVNHPDGKLARAIRYRDHENEGPPLPVDMDPGERARTMANRKASYRPGEWRFCVVPASAAPDPFSRPTHFTASVYSTCECGQHRWKEDELLSRPTRRSTSKPTQLPFA